jgi:ATP-dependent Lon protease
MSNGQPSSTPEEFPVPDTLPVLPLRDSVLFPLTAGPILIGQPRSLQLVDDVLKTNRLLGIVAQMNPGAMHPAPEDLYRVGTLATVRSATRLDGDRMMQITVTGLERIRVVDYSSTEPFLVSRFEVAPDAESSGEATEVLVTTVKTLFRQLVELSDELRNDLADVMQAQPTPRHAVYFAGSTLALGTDIKQALLELEPVNAKLERLAEVLKHEIAVRRVVRDVTAETVSELSKAQREAILRKQLEQIQKELGELEPDRADVQELRERLEKLPLPDDARKEVDRELDRLQRIPSVSAEHGIIRTWLDWIAKLPYGRTTGAPIDERKARAVLDEDHYDLDKIKERIVEYLAVKALREERAQQNGATGEGRLEPILCFAGPPGVGKTSLGQSIARSMGRKFARISLGGVHDEAEIRGHRRTYIGALPGRIVQALARAEACDPVFMLDEVDKLDRGFHGDPAAALLEVLDPAQNRSFVDTYLGVPFDLSRVLFICTANTIDSVPATLLDRMEVLSLAGYTEREKLHIAQRYRLPRELDAHGLRHDEVTLDEASLLRIIRDYTREAGVRGLERAIASVLRKVAGRVRTGAPTPVTVDAEHLREFLGPPRYYNEVLERVDRPGVATGLAWTPAGGDILFVEATMVPAERSTLLLTGMLGDVMRESARAALSWLRANAARLGIDPTSFEHKEVHVHVPAGAIPKDGPSAGLAILTAMASQASGLLAREDVAMTGEITLRGKVLAVGGIKEKVLAAHRAGIKRVVLPKRNEPDLEDVPREVLQACEVSLVDTVDDALALTLSLTPRPYEPQAPALH